MKAIKSNKITIIFTLLILFLSILSTIHEIPFIYQGASLLLISYIIIYIIGFVLQNNYNRIIKYIDYSQIALFGTIGLGFSIFYFTFFNTQALEMNQFQMMNWLFYFNIFLIFMLFYLSINRNNRKTEATLFSLTSVAVIVSIITSITSLVSGFSNLEWILCSVSAMQALISMVLINNMNDRYYPLITVFPTSMRILNNPKIAMVIPTHNEEVLIQRTLSDIPELINKIYVVNDASTDNTITKVKQMMTKDGRIELINHYTNKGVGAAIISGYIKAYEDGNDIFVVIGADAQMEMEDLINLVQPIIDREADYTKGNRFIYKTTSSEGNAFQEMPRLRLIGNIFCSILTIIASGCISVFDSQMGYTAIHRDVIPLIDWTIARQGYGYPGDWLCRLNYSNVRIKDVPTKAIYLANERQTQIKVRRFIFYTSSIMLKVYLWRLYNQYLNRNNVNQKTITVQSWILLSVIFTVISGVVFFLGLNSIPWIILSFQSVLFFVLSDLTNNHRNASVEGKSFENLVKLMDHSNDNSPDIRMEDLHIPRGILFRDPFLQNHFDPQDTDNLFSLIQKVTVGNPLSSIQEDHYPIAKMVHFEIAEENLTHAL
ncbi:MAG: glycosyltransferase family 2 protein [Candidatus Hodarchaeales archaeon]